MRPPPVHAPNLACTRTSLQAPLRPPRPSQSPPHPCWRLLPRSCPRRSSLARQGAPRGPPRASCPRRLRLCPAPPRARRRPAQAQRPRGPLPGCPLTLGPPPLPNCSPRRPLASHRRRPCWRRRPRPQQAQQSLAGACAPSHSGCETRCWAAGAATAAVAAWARRQAAQAAAPRRSRMRQLLSTALAAAGCCRICLHPTAGWPTPCCSST